MEATGSAGKLAATRDHVIPKSKWTAADRIYGPRIVWACRQCNTIKADVPPDEWDSFMGNNPEWWRLPQYQFGTNVKASPSPLSKHRIVELQKSLKIARDALTRIAYGTTSNQRIAEDALTAMWKLEPKQQLQGVVGHSRGQGA